LRGQPQVVPRPAARRAGRHPTPGRPAGGGHARDDRPRGTGRRVGGTGARRTGERRRDPGLGGHVPGTITLTGLRVRGHHGVYEVERASGQDFIVDVTLELDVTDAVRTDDVASTVHYGQLADRLVGIVAGEPVNLIETLADRLATACLADPRV